MKTTRIDTFQFGMIIGGLMSLNSNAFIAMTGNVLAIIYTILFMIDMFVSPNRYE